MRRLILFVALSISLSGVLAAPGPVIDPETPKEIQIAAMELLINRVVLEAWFASRGDDRLDAPESPMSLKEFVRTMPKPYRDYIIERDPWANAYMIGSSDRLAFWIGSGGKDQYLGSLEKFEIAAESRKDLSARRDLKSFIEDDVVLIYDKLVYGPMTDLDRIKRSMSDLRSIGTAIESFSIDENVYPTQDSGLAPVTTIEADLEPTYIRTLPQVDGWGQPYLFWSDGSQYTVLSMGADGILDPHTRSGIPGAQARGGATTDPNADIIFANGQFTQWPAGAQQ
ncbi:MAG: type II secretion system protein GspG [Acidobacteriota bacterium]|nr:type II secretion system protein GspG [Acidobacteriota bacterium]MDH3785683.1 type II secretion system protein GspG [Acidobacteriota bacterium]